MYLKLLATPDIYAVYVVESPDNITYIGTFSLRDKNWNGLPEPV